MAWTNEQNELFVKLKVKHKDDISLNFIQIKKNTRKNTIYEMRIIIFFVISIGL